MAKNSKPPEGRKKSRGKDKKKDRPSANGAEHFKTASPKSRKKEDKKMTPKDKLQEMASIEGSQGVGVFTPTGENLALLSSNPNVKLEQIGVLANNVLRNAQKASLDMGVGRGQMVHVEAEGAHILVRCLNEGNDPLKSEPGKAHIHVVLVLGSDASIGLAKLKLNALVSQLAPDFRL
jgi:predicted regulator of Ras-like GTPase activity (Roadblock/LC7/MglB family)